MKHILRNSLLYSNDPIHNGTVVLILLQYLFCFVFYAILFWVLLTLMKVSELEFQLHSGRQNSGIFLAY